MMTSFLATMFPLLMIMMMMMKGTQGYPDRIPVDHHHVCEEMEPHHNVSALTIECPYKITFNTDGCYLDHTQKITVTVYHPYQGGFFEGMFVQARRPGGPVESVGMFYNTGDPFFKPYDCFGAVNNTYGHCGHDHFFNTNFTWTPPQGFNSDVHFVATMVRSTFRFWMNVTSAVLKKNSNCVIGAVTPPPVLPTSPSHAGVIAVPPALQLVLLSFLLVLRVKWL